MCSEEWHQRSNLIRSNYELIIWRIVEETWNIRTYKWYSWNTWLEQNRNAKIEMRPISSAVSAPDSCKFLWSSKERACKNKRSLISSCPLEKSIISCQCIIVPIEVMHISMFIVNWLSFCCFKSMQVCFGHRFLEGIKTSRLIHIIPNVNIRISENVIIFQLTTIYIYRSLNIEWR